jgi:hypothetical protein
MEQIGSIFEPQYIWYSIKMLQCIFWNSPHTWKRPFEQGAGGIGKCLTHHAIACHKLALHIEPQLLGVLTPAVSTLHMAEKYCPLFMQHICLSMKSTV